MTQRYKRIITVHAETGEHVVMVRGRVSKKHNLPGVWLRLTRKHRTVLTRIWRKNNRSRYLAQQQRSNERNRQARNQWEVVNGRRRKSPRRKLFNKLRRAGVVLHEARRLSLWGVA